MRSSRRSGCWPRPATGRRSARSSSSWRAISRATVGTRLSSALSRPRRCPPRPDALPPPPSDLFGGRFVLPAPLPDVPTVRLTDFWSRMHAEFGPVYADSFARDFVLGELGGRTVEQALADGMDAKVVWRAVCAAMEWPASKV